MAHIEQVRTLLISAGSQLLECLVLLFFVGPHLFYVTAELLLCALPSKVHYGSSLVLHCGTTIAWGFLSCVLFRTFSTCIDWVI